MRLPNRPSLPSAATVLRAMAPPLRRAPRRRLAGWCMATLAAAAIAPTVVPYDHMLPDRPEAAHADDHDAGHRHIHEQHCHGTPADCADAPLTSGPGQMFGGDPLIIEPALVGVLLVVALLAPRSISMRPELRPPVQA